MSSNMEKSESDHAKPVHHKPAAAHHAPHSAHPAEHHHRSRTYISNPLELIKPSWEAFKLSWVMLILVTLAIFGSVLAFVALLVVGGPIGALIGALLIVPLIFFIGGFAGWMITKVTIEAARGHKLSFKEAMPQTFSEPWKYIWTCILFGLVVGIGFILFIVPGVIFMAWFANAPYLTVDKGVWGADALKQARDLGRGRYWDILGTISLTSAIGILMIVPYLGFLVYVILTFILIPVFAVRYNSLLELKAQPGWESVPTHPLNYVIFVLAVVASSISTNQQVNSGLQDLQNQSQLENNLKAY